MVFLGNFNWYTGGFYPNSVRKSFIALSWQLLKAIHFKRSGRKDKGGSMSIASFHSSHMRVSMYSTYAHCTMGQLYSGGHHPPKLLDFVKSQIAEEN